MPGCSSALAYLHLRARDGTSTFVEGPDLCALGILVVALKRKLGAPAHVPCSKPQLPGDKGSSTRPWGLWAKLLF